MNRIQQAAYSLVSEGPERNSFHLLIGIVMIRKRSSEEWEEWMLLVAVDQLNLGFSYIDVEEECLSLSNQDLEAAEFAMMKSCIHPRSEVS
jgi:predicted ATPase